MLVTYPVRQLIAVISGADGTRAEKKRPRKTDLQRFLLEHGCGIREVREPKPNVCVSK